MLRRGEQQRKTHHHNSLPLPLPIRRADHSPIRSTNRHNNNNSGIDASRNSSTSGAGSSTTSSSSRDVGEKIHYDDAHSHSATGDESNASRLDDDRQNLSDLDKNGSRRHGVRAPRPRHARSSDPPRGRKGVASSLEETWRAAGNGGRSAGASVDGRERVSAAGRLGRSGGDGRSAVERGLVAVGESLLLRSSSGSAIMSLPTLPNGLVGGEAVPALLSHLAGWWAQRYMLVFVCCVVPSAVVLRFHLCFQQKRLLCCFVVRTRNYGRQPHLSMESMVYS